MAATQSLLETRELLYEPVRTPGPQKAGGVGKNAVRTPSAIVLLADQERTLREVVFLHGNSSGLPVFVRYQFRTVALRGVLWMIRAPVMALKFSRVIGPIEDMEIWSASSNGFSFVIS